MRHWHRGLRASGKVRNASPRRTIVGHRHLRRPYIPTLRARAPSLLTAAPLKDQVVARKQYSQLVVAAGVVRDACVRALQYIGTMHGKDARARFLTNLRHAFHDWCRPNRPSGVARDDGSAIHIAINDDGLPACRAVPWLPIPSGLGRGVRASPGLPQILKLPPNCAGRVCGSRPRTRVRRYDLSGLTTINMG